MQCYGNRLGQKFFSMKDLLSYVEYAKRNKLSIYAPGFEDANTNSEEKEPETEAVESSNLKEMDSDEKGKKSELNLAGSSDGFKDLADSNVGDQKPGSEAGAVSGLKDMDSDVKGKAPEPPAVDQDKEQTVKPFKKIKLTLHPNCSKYSTVARTPPRRSSRLASRTQT